MLYFLCPPECNLIDIIHNINKFKLHLSEAHTIEQLQSEMKSFNHLA